MSINFKVFPLAIDTANGFSVSSEFNSAGRFHPVHKRVRPHYGTDIPAQRGTILRAVDDGEVVALNQNSPSAGKLIGIRYGTYRVDYFHMDSIESSMRVGKKVKAGETVGTVGNTGADSDGPHLHIELYNENGVRIDPTPFLRQAAGNSIPVTPSTDPAPQTTPSDQTQLPPIGKYRRVDIGDVSPYIALTDSFHPKIQYELTKRRLGSETANVYMPYAKLTSLLKVKVSNLQGNASPIVKEVLVNVGELEKIPVSIGAHSPSIGIHERPEISFDDIYNPQDNKSIVGYATVDSQTGPLRVPMVVETSDVDPPNIPPVGITAVTVERSTAGPMGVRGGLFRTNLKIVAYSIGQLNTLLTYFLRPGTKVVLELGRMSATPDKDTTSTTDQFFNWKRTEAEVKSELESIVMRGGDQKQLIKNYVIDKNFGNYELLVGYVVNFKLKITGNRYDIDLSVNSLQQFEIPLKNTGTRALCTTGAVQDNSIAVGIDEYFAPSDNWRRNTLTKLLSEVSDENKTTYQQWRQHVIKMRGTGADNPTAGGSLVTWRFFTDVILNDKDLGLMSVFNLNNPDETRMLDMVKTGLLKPYSDDKLDFVPNAIIDGQVGYHPNLRSTDPDVMVIWNTKAQQNPRVQNNIQDAKNQGVWEQALANSEDAPDELTENIITAIRRPIGGMPRPSFDEITPNSGISSLFAGTWLNTNAIIKAFEGADTLTKALSNLLTAMNNATDGYWNLQLMSDDINSAGVSVIDMALSKKTLQVPIRLEQDKLISGLVDDQQQAIRELTGISADSPKYIYKFNRKLSKFDNTDETLSGELLDINIQSGLPHVVAVQALAGVGGIGQRGTLALIDVDELKALSMFDTYPSCQATSGSASYTGAVGEQDDETLIAQKFITDAVARAYATQAIQKGLDTIPTDRVYAYVQAAVSNGKFPSTGLGIISTIVEKRINYMIKKLKEEYAQQNSGLLALAKMYANSFGRALELIEWDKTSMTQEIEGAASSENETANSFNSSNLTKTIVELTMPGIAGIQLFQSFEVDRVPSFLNKGYYVVTKINHDFSSTNGWTTKITGRFRYDPRDDNDPV